MKKRTQIIRRIFSLFVAAAVLGSGAPVYGSEDFSDGMETDFFIPGETEDILTEEETIGFGDTQVTAFTDEETSLDEDIHYIKGRPLTEEERRKELAPFGNLTELGEAPEVDSDLGMTTYALYPSRFDTREMGLVTEVKNQHPFGICWAFGMASILETSLLAQNRGTMDLSEEHLAYFFTNRENDPLNNTAGDYNYNRQGYHQGGNDYLASIFLTTWSGMTTEESVPLPTDMNHTEDYSEPIPAEKAYEAAAYLTDASFSDYSVERMKQMVYQDYSAAIMYYMDTWYYNPDTGGYSCPDTHKINHVVTVVGWDDNYKKENFSLNSGVENDGAWIVKNSWGAQWGEDGYFYLSYEDKNISGLVSAKAAVTPKYKNNYFYDGSSGLKTISLKKGQSAANIFTAKAKPGHMEAIGEVNAVTYSDNAHYTVQIYTDVEDLADPTSGKQAYAKPIEVYQPIAGVKTINVPEVNVTYGAMYSVVITNAESENMKFCVEGSGEHGEWFSGHAEVKTGQGFFGTTKGEWTDLISLKATPRIKVHTKTLDKITVPVMKGSVKGYDKVGLSWNKVNGVSGYCVYRSEAGKTKKKIVDLAASKTSYTDSGLKTGVKYIYTLVPYIKVSGKITYGSASKTVTVTPMLDKPAFEAKASVNGYNLVTWKKVSGATNYRIYRKSPSGKWQYLLTVGSSVTEYKDKKITPCASYQYTVRAWRKTSSYSYLSKYTEGEVIKAAPARQNVSSVSGSSAGIRIKWKTQGKCDGYIIYRKTKSGSWKKIKTISSRSTSTYLDKTVSNDVLYYYAIRAYVKEPYGNVYSKYTASAAVMRK